MYYNLLDKFQRKNRADREELYKQAKNAQALQEEPMQQPTKLVEAPKEPSTPRKRKVHKIS